MARTFDDANQERLNLGSAFITTDPITMACWFNSNDTAIHQSLMWLGNNNFEGGYGLEIREAGSNNEVRAFKQQDTPVGVFAQAISSVGYTPNQWEHACAVFASTTDRRAFLNGGNKGVNAALINNPTADFFTIGAKRINAVSLWCSGSIAEAGIWNIALSDEEVAMLGLGLSPLFVRPENLIRYWPLIRDNDTDWMEGTVLTPINAPTVSPHPAEVVHPVISDVSFIITPPPPPPAPTVLSKPALSTPGFSDYKVRLKDQSGILVAEFDAWRSLSFSHIINSPGACRIEIDANDSRAELFELDGQIEVWRRNLDVELDWYIEWEGFHRTDNDLVQLNDNESFVSYALGYLTLLNRRHIMYFAGEVQTDKSGVGETVIKEFVNENAGPGALSANGRLGGIDADILGLSIEADQASGTNWEGARAYKNLLTTVAEIALDTGVDIEIVSNGVALYEFKVHDGQRGEDRTVVGLDSAGLNAAGNAPVIFSLGFGNMAVPISSNNRSTEANAVYALGQGEKSARTIVLREDLGAIADSPINRIEIIQNATQETTTAGLNSVGDEALETNQKKETLGFTALQLEGTFYGKDYTWGDLITARFRNKEFNKKIVDVRVVVSNTQQGEKITVEFGDIP